MGLTQRLNALTQAVRAAHAALRVYGTEPELEPYLMQTHLNARRLWKTRRIAHMPAADSLPNPYERPSSLDGLEKDLNSRVGRMLRGAVDAGNGNVLDRSIEHLAAEAQFELRVEHSLRASTAQLLVIRNRGDAARIPVQLADVQSRLAETERERATIPQGDLWRPASRKASHPASPKASRPAPPKASRKERSTHG
jgi:hypothetical protein